MKTIITLAIVALMLALLVSPQAGAFTSPIASPLPTLAECYADCPGDEYKWMCEKSCRCALGIDTRCSLADYEAERPCPPPHAERMEDWMGYPLWRWESLEGRIYYCVEG